MTESMSNSSDWMQLYQNFPNIAQIQGPPSSSPITTTTATIATTSRNVNLSPYQGRVSRPIRRRTRASRKTPTTLLNTDTTNFRAMVQHFTGGPTTAATVAAGSQLADAIGFTQQIPFTTGVVAPVPAFHVQSASQMQQRVVVMDSASHGGGGGNLPFSAPPAGSSTAGNENRNYDRYLL